MDRSNHWSQEPYAVRLGWGLAGLRALSPGSDTIIIVDVLSFCTSVSLVVSQGGIVLPYSGSLDDLPRRATMVGAEYASPTVERIADIPWPLVVARHSARHAVADAIAQRLDAVMRRGRHACTRRLPEECFGSRRRGPSTGTAYLGHCRRRALARWFSAPGSRRPARRRRHYARAIVGPLSRELLRAGRSVRGGAQSPRAALGLCLRTGTDRWRIRAGCALGCRAGC